MVEEGGEDDWAGHGKSSENLKIGPLGSGSGPSESEENK